MSARGGSGIVALASTRSIAIAAGCVIVLGFAGSVMETTDRLGTTALDAQTWGKIILNSGVRSFKFFSLDVVDQPENANWALALARFSGAIVAMLALLKVIARAFQREFASVRVNFCRRHAAILGLGMRNSLFAKDIARNRVGVIAAVDLEAPSAKAIGAGRRSIGLDADLSVPARAAAANLRDASLVLIGLGSDERNLAVASTVVGAPGRIARDVIVTIDDSALAERCERDPGVTRPVGGDNVYVFNVSRVTARSLIERRPMVDLALGAGQKRVRLVVIGSSDVALECVLQFLRISPCVGLDRPLVQLLVDDRSATESQLVDRARNLAGVLRPNANQSPNEPLAWALEMALFERRNADVAPEIGLIDALDAATPDPVTAVIVAGPESVSNVKTALVLRERLRERPGWAAPIFVKTGPRSSLDALLTRLDGGDMPSGPALRASADPAKVVEPFGLLEQICTVETIIGGRERKARELHEAYLASRAARSDSASAKPWLELDESFRRANRRAIDHLTIKTISRTHMADAGLSDELALERLAEIEHDSWRIDRELDGWRYGETRDDARMIHPDLKPFAALSEERRSSVAEFVLSVTPL